MGKYKELFIVLVLMFASYWVAFVIQYMAGATYSQIVSYAGQEVTLSDSSFNKVKLGDGRYVNIHLSSVSKEPRLIRLSGAELSNTEPRVLEHLDIQLRVWESTIELREDAKDIGSQLLIVTLTEKMTSSGSTYSIMSDISIIPRVREVNNSEAKRSTLEQGVESGNLSYIRNDIRPLVKIKGRFWGDSVQMSVDQNTFKGLVLSEARRAANILGVEIDRQQLDQIGEIVSHRLLRQFPVFKLRKGDHVSVLIFSGVVEQIILMVFSFALLLTGYVVVRHVYHVRGDDVGEAKVERTQSFGMRAAQFGQMLTLLGLLGTLIGVFYTVVTLGNADFVDELRKVFDQSESFGAMGLAIATSVLGVGGSIVVLATHNVIAMVLGRDYFKTDG